MPAPPHTIDRTLFAIIGVLIQAAVAAAENTPPVAVDGHLATPIEQAAHSALTASDPDGNALTFQIVASPIKGTLVITDAGTGAFVYTPRQFESGADLFTFQVSDGQATSAVTSFTIAITEPGGRVPVFQALATIPGQLAAAPQLVDGNPGTSWTSDPAMTGDLGIVIDLRDSRRVWRVVIHWGDGGHATAYEVRSTNLTLFRELDGHGGSEDIRVAANVFVQYLVVVIKRLPHETGRAFEIREIEVYATEASNHLSRNPPPTPGDPLDATTFAALTDGDGATIGAGQFSSVPMEFSITRDHNFPVHLQRLVLFWGDAYASDYEISLLERCTSLASVELQRTGSVGGVEVIDLPADLVDYACMRIRFLTGPANHFELREVEIYGPLADNAARASLASTSANAGGSAAAIDRDLSTEWVSEPSAGPAWFLVEVPSPTRLSKIRIVWGDYAPRNFAVFVAGDGPFEPYYATNVGDGRVDIIYNGFRTIRYALVVMEPTDVGYSIREIEVYRARVVFP